MGAARGPSLIRGLAPSAGVLKVLLPWFRLAMSSLHNLWAFSVGLLLRDARLIVALSKMVAVSPSAAYPHNRARRGRLSSRNAVECVVSMCLRWVYSTPRPRAIHQPSWAITEHDVYGLRPPMSYSEKSTASIVVLLGEEALANLLEPVWIAILRV